MKKSDLVTVVLIYISFSFKILFTGGSGQLEMEVWDVGQGDAIYISTPNGKKILIDGGDNYQADFNISRKTPFYSCYIDLLVLTHPHYDHIVSLNRLLQHCRIGTVMFNDVDFSTPQFSYFKHMSEKNNVKNVFAGDEFEIDGVYFKVLWPTKDFLKGNISDINDVSIVIFLDYGDFEALFTGDATDKVLGNIDYSSIEVLVDGNFDVLKVPHHGSKYSLHKEFYSKLKPEKCVISVGEGNKFGHPSPLIIEYFEDTGCEILRTDKLGDIKFYIR
jgi:competence protein ComEC